MAQVPDIRLEDKPAEPTRLWYWWINSTPRAVIRKILGVDTDRDFSDRSIQLLVETVNKQTAAISKLHKEIRTLAEHAADTNHRLEFYEKHNESIRYLRERYDRQGKKIQLLSAVQ